MTFGLFPSAAYAHAPNACASGLPGPSILISGSTKSMYPRELSCRGTRMKLETKRHAAWSRTGMTGPRGMPSPEEEDVVEVAGEISRDLGEERVSEEDDEEEEEGQGASVVGRCVGGGLRVALRARRSVACVSLRWTMSNSSL